MRPEAPQGVARESTTSTTRPKLHTFGLGCKVSKEAMMPAASASTTSVLQTVPTTISTKRKTLRRKSPTRTRSQQRQQSVPVHPVASKSEVALENTTHASSSGAHIVRQVNDGNKKEDSAVVECVDKDVLSQDIGGVERLTGVGAGAGDAHEGEKPATSKLQRVKTHTVRTLRATTLRFKGQKYAQEGEKPTTPKLQRATTFSFNRQKYAQEGENPTTSKLQRAKTAVRTLRAATSRFKRQKPKMEGPAENAPQLPSSSSAQHGENLPPVISPFTEGDQEETANVCAGQTASESEEIEKLRRHLSESNYRVAELQKRCDAQSKDLKGSNDFLNTADKSSDSDIINALHRLNAEVQQNTTFVADCLAEDLEFSSDWTNSTKEQDLAVQRASGHIGRVLIKSFRTKTPEHIPMLLQIAFQAYFVSALCQTVSSWAFEPSNNAFIDDIYQRLRKAEAQAVSGRWRALARVHTVHNWISNPGSQVKGIIAGLSDILIAAGCTATPSDVILKVTSKFEEKITLLVELAGRLNKLFDEIISGDFEVFAVGPGEKFDRKKMEDTDSDEVGIQEELVLCATHMGLVKRIPVGTLWEKGRKQKTVVLKAKVVLESFLNTED